MRELTKQEKTDIVSMDEVMTFFFIDECSSFIWKTNHDLSDGRIEESAIPTITEDVEQISQLQKFTVDNLDRFGIDVIEESDLKKWYEHWTTWRSELTDEQWEKVSVGEYEEYLPTKKWNQE